MKTEERLVDVTISGLLFLSESGRHGTPVKNTGEKGRKLQRLVCADLTIIIFILILKTHLLIVIQGKKHLSSAQ